MEKVVKLLADLKVKVEADGKAEQKSYDKYACWCEDTLGRKASDISEAKTSIEDFTQLIIKTKAQLASHSGEIKNLKKMIGANVDSQREASQVRGKEHADYAEDRAESENCIGALEAAIKVLNGAGSKKGSFLGTLQEAQLLGVVAGIKGVLKTKEVTKRFSDTEIEAVEKFAEKPEDFIGGHTEGFSAAQVANNPFGDYAPQSTQIQGILKGMYDGFAEDLEKDNADESEKQKSHEELMATKKSELATLEATLENTELSAASATKTLADSKETLDDTKETLSADETFFGDSKESCQTKAGMWAERTRLRTEELSGMAQAIAIMSSPEAKKTFSSATTTFLQLSSVTKEDGDRIKAYGRVKALATTYKSLSLAKLAVFIKTSGHFDKIISMIDTMIGLMRKEEAEDIKHRDRCEEKQNANKNNRDDLDHDITKAKESINRMGNSKDELDKSLKAVVSEIEATEKSMADLLEMRNKGESDFKQALKDDTNAVVLITEALGFLNKFYADNKISLLQADPDKAPATSFDDGNYGGSGSTGGILAILGMLKDDLVKEIKTGKAGEAENQAAYEQDRGALQATLDAQNKKKSSVEGDIADMGTKIEDSEEDQGNKESDLAAEKDVQKSLDTDCAWVKTTFDTRKEKRKLEMDGLVEAKEFLAGVDGGEAVLPPLSP
jgi:hypothetical protein